MNTIDEIKNLKSLLDKGAITSEEFNELKKRVFSQEFYSNNVQVSSPPASIQGRLNPKIVNFSQEIKIEKQEAFTTLSLNQDSAEGEFGIPLWIGWMINAIAWALFIITDNHGVELLIGLICIFAFYIGLKHKHNNLMYSSIFETAWMFAWGLGILDSSYF